MTPFLAIHAKGGDSMSPKQKDRTTTYFKNDFSNWKFHIGVFQVQKGEIVEFSKLIS
jgi:hypothetical protein